MGVAIFDGESAVGNLRFLMELGSARTESRWKIAGFLRKRLVS
jgi:hypothetical protein